MIERTRAGTQPEKIQYEAARIAVVKGPDKGLSLEAAGRSLRVGTAADNDIVLRDDSVSRRHCEIELTECGFRVRDIGSTNGIRVEGIRIYDASFTSPLKLVLGDTTLSIAPLSKTIDREQSSAAQFGDLIGASAKMRELFLDLERLAPTELSVLIEGETGTGKDVVAESLHRASSRAEEPYVVFDCSAVAPTLVESELFGHERGAFTGASNARPGVFEEAHGGTLFLDEIGELPKELQPKLLRALEKREVKRLGGRKPMAVDVRVVSATNRHLLTEVQRGAFREDLYYRVAAAHVLVPPLRERLDDLPLLVEHFLSLSKRELWAKDIPDHVWSMLRGHRWPGNVRELRNAVQRLLVSPELSLRTDPRAQHSEAATAAAQVPSVRLTGEPLRVARRSMGDRFERDYVGELLARTAGNMSRAAGIAEVSRQMIQKLIKKHGLG